MFRSIVIITIISLISTVACMKPQTETNAAGNPAAEAKSSNGNDNSQNISEKVKEKSGISDANKKIFRGMINGTSFEMNLRREGDKLSGTYFYTKIGKNLNLSGTVDAKGNFNLKETDASGKGTGEWSGTWKEEKNDNGVTIEGTWNKPQQSKDQGLGFYATEQVIEFTGSAKFVDKNIQENDKAKRSEIHSVYPEISGIGNESAAKFNELIKKTVVNANNAYRKDVAEMDVNDLREGMTLNNEIGYDVALATNDFVSLTLSDYTFMGGAHGGTSYTTVNYDLKNNRELNLEDIFNPNSNYLKILSNYAVTDLKSRLSEMSDDEWITKGAAPEAENYKNWNLTNKGLMLTFEQYQVAAYAAGPQTVMVPYDNLKAVLRKDSVAANLAKLD